MSELLGLMACGVSTLFFGSMFVPIRRCKPGDGLFVQWVMSSSIFTVGMLVYLYRGMPPFQPLAMLGGFSWCVGNLTAMPIISSVGLGLGVLIWGSVNCVIGWAVGRFGLFGIKASIPSSPTINYVGLILVVVGGFLFSQVKANVKEEHTEDDETPAAVVAPVVPSPTDVNSDEELAGLMDNTPEQASPQPVEEPVTNSRPNKKIVGILLSLVAGACYGLTFVPVVYIQDNPEKFHNPPKAAIDYVFSHYSGIYLTSTAFLLIYLIFKKNSPYIDHHIIGPTFFSGLLWAIAQMAWFVANDCLSQVITFPINSMVPGVVATIWSVFYFKEIKGRRNFQILALAILITLTGAALVGLSKGL